MQSTGDFFPLFRLPMGEVALIQAFYLYGEIGQQLRQVGWTPGVSIQKCRTAPGGALTAYTVAGVMIGLRKSDAKMIMVKRISKTD